MDLDGVLLFMTLANPGKDGYCAVRNSKESRTSKA